MVDLMASTEGKISFEFFGSWLLLHTDQLEPAFFACVTQTTVGPRALAPTL
jgi:hypothetical protein